MASKPPATIYDLLQLPAGDKQNASWVNDEFEGVVSDVKKGQKSTSCKISDPHNPGVSITGVFWDGRDLSRFVGCVCHFAGQGMKRTEYKGEQQVSFSEKSTVNMVGRHTGTPAGNGGAQSAPKAGGGNAPAPAAGGVIHGATVGMAINQANGIIIAGTNGMKSEDREKFFDSPEYSRRLWTLASDIVRVSRLMEGGKLATAPKDRADPNYAAKQKEAAEKAEADRKAAEEAERKRLEAEQRQNNTGGAQGNLDEEVPF